MINGELIVDNFAGGGGEADTEHENSSRADRAASVCVGRSQSGKRNEVSAIKEPKAISDING